MAVPDFSKVAVTKVFCKNVVLENLANHRCFSVNFGRFSKNTSGGCFWKVKSRSSRLEVFCKNGVLRNFAKFTGKHLVSFLQSYTCNFVKIVSETGVFLWILQTPFSEHLFYRTPLAASVKACNFTKIKFRHGCFFL